MTTQPPADAWVRRTIRSTLGLAAWTVAWVASLALARFGPGSLWNDQPALTLVAIACTVLIGIGMLFAHKRYLQTLDELQRSTQMQAMAWSLGAGLVGGLAWSLFARHNLVGIEPGIEHLVGIMAVVYMVGSIVGTLRYR